MNAAVGDLTQRGAGNQAGSCTVGGAAGKLCESFTYDSLERLDTVSRNGTQTLNVDYDLIGNITSRSDVGTYSYHASKKHAVTAAGSNTFAYDANGNVITRNGASLGWASYDLPTALVAGSNSASFAYAPDRSRWRQVATTAGVTVTTIYVAGILEKVTKPSLTLWKHTVIGPTGLGAVYVRRSDGTADTYYLTTDHLGSTDKVLKAAGSTLQVAESFAPYGARRGRTWTGAPSGADLTAIGNSTRDGFTGHEMLDGVGLIHMNGRVYDPAVGRFLSVDPLVREAAASQSWNGYGYVEGRVLSSIDPNGYSLVGISVRGFIKRIEGRVSGGTSSGASASGSGDACPGCENITVTASRLYWDWSAVRDLLGSLERDSMDFRVSGGGTGGGSGGGDGGPQEQPTTCPSVPATPPGVDVRNNVEIARDHSSLNPGSVYAFYQLVRNGGDWDYKQFGKVPGVPSPYEAFGNFNYGAAGAAMGIPDLVLLRAAGAASILAGTSPSNSSNPLGRSPYGDNPVDQAWIQEGIAYSQCSRGAGP